jgi:hypothetical protein
MRKMFGASPLVELYKLRVFEKRVLGSMSKIKITC